MALMERVWPIVEDTRLAFNEVAADYDRSNAGNPILCHMRQQTLDAVVEHAPRGARVLDLGCGPGTDAETLTRGGRLVTAIDWSPAMTSQTRRRLQSVGAAGGMDVHTLGIHELPSLPPALYDAAYSNLGPLNCVPSLPDAARFIADRLRPGGVLVASVIGRICPWEIALYLTRGNWARARVRFAQHFVAVPLAERTVWTRYYTPVEFERACAGAGFRRISVRALGLFAPPPYLQAFAERHPAFVAGLQGLDDRFGAWPGLRSMGDHFLMVLRRT